MTTISIDDIDYGDLSTAQRLLLAQSLLDSVYDDVESRPLSDAQLGKLRERVALANADPSGGAAWEDVEAELRAVRRR